MSSPDPRLLVGAAVLTGALVLTGSAWASSRVGEYSVMSTGHAVGGHRMPGGAGSVDVTSLVADPDRPADVRVELVARRGTVRVAGGRTFAGYTVNGTSPGPTLRVRQGDLVEAVFINESVEDGATIHWHGVDVPNAADGVAGVTQDAVPVGGRHVYRFVAEDAGTYWYHSHQMSHEQVGRGLLGALVVEPEWVEPGSAEPGSVDMGSVDEVALLHVYGGQHTLNGAANDARITAAPGTRVRVRVINTDQGTAAVWASSPFRVAATDGHEVSGPTDVLGEKVLVPAGGRVDVSLVVPESGGARVHVGGARSILIGPEAAEVPAVRQPTRSVDLLTYGAPASAGFDGTQPTRTFDYVIDRRLGFLDGRPGQFWTINGHMFPDVPMFHAREGDVVRFRVANESGEVHPMHLHGHHVLVLSRNGVAAQGSPWVVDSLDVYPRETYEVAFVADNPGIWSDHCHILRHAVDGLIAHVVYEGVSTPFTIGGRQANHPE